MRQHIKSQTHMTHQATAQGKNDTLIEKMNGPLIDDNEEVQKFQTDAMPHTIETKGGRKPVKEVFPPGIGVRMERKTKRSWVPIDKRKAISFDEFYRFLTNDNLDKKEFEWYDGKIKCTLCNKHVAEGKYMRQHIKSQTHMTHQATAQGKMTH